MKNILITSAGRRVSLVMEFKQAAALIDKGIKVFTADRLPLLAPACHVSDGSFEVRFATAEGYIDEIIENCKVYDIGIVIPTLDTCLPVLAKNKLLFEENGINVIISSFELVDICRYKDKTIRFFNEHNIRCPKLIDIKNPSFPMFAKPIDGSSSKGTLRIMSEKDLSANVKCNANLLFMEYVDNKEYREFTVDMYYGRDNHVKCIVPRERIEVRSGEVSKGITRKNYLVDFLKERFEHLPGVVGCICIQLFYRECDNDVLGIEINPRFGGGYPLSFYAGANFPKMLLEEYLLGRQIEYSDDWQNNVLMLRYDAEVISHGQ